MMEVKHLAMLEAQLEPKKHQTCFSYLCQSPIPAASLATSCASSGSPLRCHILRESLPDDYSPNTVTHHGSSSDRSSVPSTYERPCLSPSTTTLSPSSKLRGQCLPAPDSHSVFSSPSSGQPHMKAWSWVGVWSLASLGQKGPSILRASSSYVPSPFFPLASLLLRLNGEPRPEGFLGLGTLDKDRQADWASYSYCD